MFSREERKGKGAYMTLEASLLMPLVTVLCGLLILLSFYLYMVVFLGQAAYVAALRGSLAEDGEGDRGVIAEKELDRILEEGILPVRNVEKQVSATGLSVKVTLRAEVPLPFPQILPVENRVWQIHVEKKAQVRDAAAFIRGIRKLSLVHRPIAFFHCPALRWDERTVHASIDGMRGEPPEAAECEET